MNTMNPLLMTDFYKTSHYKMYPDGTTKIYSNFTPRKSRKEGINKVVVFGIQYFIKEYLINQWNTNFFKKDKDIVIEEYKRMMDFTLGPGAVDMKHIEDLWELQYLPIRIKSLPEGSLCPIGVPCSTIVNTVDHAYWLVNYLETIFSCTVWMPITSATIALEYKKILNRYAMETVGNTDFVQWQGHDFSMRGMQGKEDAILSGMAHLLSFTGTDTIPAIWALEKYYNANVENEMVGGSVAASEHSVASMLTEITEEKVDGITKVKTNELKGIRSLLAKYPKGILSMVSDTYDLFRMLTEYLVELKQEILSRENGKLVIRPDSGDPVKIVTGYFDNEIIHKDNKYFTKDDDGYFTIEISDAERKGVIELLWETFGGTQTPKGFKLLDSHVSAIYGDSITLERAEQICERLKKKGFASINIIFGIGSFTYTYTTRDYFGMAQKSTYGEINHVGREIFKDPKTDDGTKRSLRGLIKVEEILTADSLGKLHHSTYKAIDRVTAEQEKEGALEIVFEDGKLVKDQSLSQIREKLTSSL